MTFKSAPLALAILLTFPSPLPAQNPAQQAPADTLFAQGHYLRAQLIIQANLQKNPTDPHTLVQASALQWAFFHQDISVALAQKAVALADNTFETHAQLANALGVKLMSNTAGTMEKIGLARQFRKEAERALQLNPNNPDTLEDMAQYLWNAPGFIGGDKSKAQQLADHLTQLDPAHGATLKASFAAEDKDKAHRYATIEALWKQAVASKPNSYDAHIGLAGTYLQEAADTAYTPAGRDKPTTLHLAETEDERALAIDPTRIAAYLQLTILYVTTTRWDNLEATIKHARASVPDDLSPQYQAARLILVQNVSTQLPRAEQYLRTYLTQPAEGQEPPLAAAHWRLGLILEKQGHKEEALREIQTAVNQDPSLEPAKKDLKRLQ